MSTLSARALALALAHDHGATDELRQRNTLLRVLEESNIERSVREDVADICAIKGVDSLAIAAGLLDAAAVAAACYLTMDEAAAVIERCQRKAHMLGVTFGRTRVRAAERTMPAPEFLAPIARSAAGSQTAVGSGRVHWPGPPPEHRRLQRQLSPASPSPRRRRPAPPQPPSACDEADASTWLASPATRTFIAASGSLPALAATGSGRRRSQHRPRTIAAGGTAGGLAPLDEAATQRSRWAAPCQDEGADVSLSLDFTAMSADVPEPSGESGFAASRFNLFRSGKLSRPWGAASGALAAAPAERDEMISVKSASCSEFALHKARPPLTGARWKPYENAWTENLVMPWLPRSFYQLRWALMNASPLTRRVYKGRCTLGELLLVAILIAEMAWITLDFALDADGMRSDVQLTGKVSSLLLMLTFFTAVHNNSVLLLALGLPFDRALPWHKLLAFSSIFNSVFHLLSFYCSGRHASVIDPHSPYHMTGRTDKTTGLEISGWILLGAMCWMSALAIPWVSKRCFAAFYKTHILMATAVGVGALFHGFGSSAFEGRVPLSIPGLAFWLLDLIIRFATLNRLTCNKSANLRLIEGRGGGAPIVEFSVRNSHRRFNAGQWVFICIPMLGVLHWHPFTISSAAHDVDLKLHFVCGGKWTRQVAQLAKAQQSVKAYIEGPYGAPMIDTLGTRFACFLIISSGLGWTLLRACKRQLLSDVERGRIVRSIQTVVCMKAHDQHLLDEFGGWEPQGSGVAPSADQCSDLREDIFLTGKLPESASGQAALPHRSDSCGTVTFHAGRPQLDNLFAQAEQQALRAGEARVAVLVCGNEAVKDMVLWECSKSRRSAVVFEPHYEAFGF